MRPPSLRLLAPVLLLACSSPRAPAPPAGPTAARTYPLRGVVVGVNPQSREVFISHEAIPGFMEAMTMPFYVRTPQELEGIRPGDRVTAKLVVGPDDTRLEDLRASPGGDR